MGPHGECKILRPFRLDDSSSQLQFLKAFVVHHNKSDIAELAIPADFNLPEGWCPLANPPLPRNSGVSIAIFQASVDEFRQNTLGRVVSLLSSSLYVYVVLIVLFLIASCVVSYHGGVSIFLCRLL